MAQLDEVAAWITAYEDAKRQIKRYEDIKAQARRVIVEALGDDDTGTVAGVERVRFREVAGRINSESLRAAHPDIAARFTGEPSRRFEVINDE